MQYQLLSLNDATEILKANKTECLFMDRELMPIDKAGYLYRMTGEVSMSKSKMYVAVNSRHGGVNLISGRLESWADRLADIGFTCSLRTDRKVTRAVLLYATTILSFASGNIVRVALSDILIDPCELIKRMFGYDLKSQLDREIILGNEVETAWGYIASMAIGRVMSDQFEREEYDEDSKLEPVVVLSRGKRLFGAVLTVWSGGFLVAPVNAQASLCKTEKSTGAQECCSIVSGIPQYCYTCTANGVCVDGKSGVATNSETELKAECDESRCTWNNADSNGFPRSLVVIACRQSCSNDVLRVIGYAPGDIFRQSDAISGKEEVAPTPAAAPTSTPSSSEHVDSQSNNSLGIILGASASAILIAILCGLICLWLIRRSRRRTRLEANLVQTPAVFVSDAASQLGSGQLPAYSEEIHNKDIEDCNVANLTSNDVHTANIRVGEGPAIKMPATERLSLQPNLDFKSFR